MRMLQYTVKKFYVTYQTLPGRGKLFLARVSLVSDIPAGDGKNSNPFFYNLVV